MTEILSPKRKNIEEEFRRGFEGMTAEQVPLDGLLQAREDVIASMVGRMPEIHRRFLLSFERGEPDWKSLAIAGAEKLPAVRWRQRNLDSLSAGQRNKLAVQLARVFSENSSATATSQA